MQELPTLPTTFLPIHAPSSVSFSNFINASVGKTRKARLIKCQLLRVFPHVKERPSHHPRGRTVNARQALGM